MSRTAVVADLDGCFEEELSNSWEQVLQKLSSLIGGDSLSSGTKVVKELLGIRPRYSQREDVAEFLEEQEFDRSYLVTGRPYHLEKVRELTAQRVAAFEHEFDEVILYPGINLDGERVVDNELGWWQLFFDNGIPEYKQQVVTSLDTPYDITLIDDSFEVHRAVPESLNVDQYLVNGHLQPYNGE